MKKQFIFCLLIPIVLLAQSKYAADFLDIPVGLREAGMGMAGVATVVGNAAFHWNPAGLIEDENQVLTLSYTPLYGDFKNSLADFYHFGIGIPLRNAKVSINIIRLSVSDIPIFGDYEAIRDLGPGFVWNDALVKPEGYFSSAETAYIGTFCRDINFEMDLGWAYYTVPVAMPIGVNVKYIKMDGYEVSGSGLGVDLGCKVKFNLGDFFNQEILQDIAWGIIVRDITTTYINWGGNITDERKPSIDAGWAYSHKIPDKRVSFIYSYQYSGMEKRNNWGVELTWDNAVNLRIGRGFGEWQYGAGFKLWRTGFNYSYQNHALNNIHRVSVNFFLNNLF